MLSDIGYSPPSPVGLRGGGCQHWLAPPRSGDRPYVFRPTAPPAMPSVAAALLGRAAGSRVALTPSCAMPWGVLTRPGSRARSCGGGQALTCAPRPVRRRPGRCDSPHAGHRDYRRDPVDRPGTDWVVVVRAVTRCRNRAPATHTGQAHTRTHALRTVSVSRSRSQPERLRHDRRVPVLVITGCCWASGGTSGARSAAQESSGLHAAVMCHGERFLTPSPWPRMTVVGRRLDVAWLIGCNLGHDARVEPRGGTE
jgi:hypothetical protein